MVTLAHTYVFHMDRHEKTHRSADNHIYVYEDSELTYKVMCVFIQQSPVVLPGFSRVHTRHTLPNKCDLHPITLGVEPIRSITHRDANPEMVCDPPNTEGWQ